MITQTSNSYWMSIKDAYPMAIEKAGLLGREACWFIGDAYLWICMIFQKAFIRPEKRIEITSTSFIYSKIENDINKK